MAPPGLATIVKRPIASARPRLILQPWAVEARGAVVRHGVLLGVVGLLAAAVLWHPAMALVGAAWLVLPRAMRSELLDAALRGWADIAAWGLALGAAAGLTYASGGAVLAGVVWAAVALVALRTATLGVALLHVVTVRLRVHHGTEQPVFLGRTPLGGVLGRSAPDAAVVICGALTLVGAVVLWGTGLLPANLDGVVAALLIAGGLSALRAWWR